MQSFVHVDSINKWLDANRLEGKSIGFVPTMGALHDGHLSLISEARRSCDIVVSSVFVNPTQFNSQEDLEKYPRTLESDVRMLIKSNCDAVFVPEVTTIYPDFPNQKKFIDMDFNGLDKMMEGAFRPGHFDGVVNVVYRLFDIIKPDRAYFGEKDFQQLTIIKAMVEQFSLNVDVVACATLREESGLAMSSRNMRLSAAGKRDAVAIYQSMLMAKELSHNFSPSQVIHECVKHFENSNLELEYFTIVDSNTLQTLNENWTNGARCFVAAYCEGVRLIDNMELIP